MDLHSILRLYYKCKLQSACYIPIQHLLYLLYHIIPYFSIFFPKNKSVIVISDGGFCSNLPFFKFTFCNFFRIAAGDITLIRFAVFCHCRVIFKILLIGLQCSGCAAGTFNFIIKSMKIGRFTVGNKRFTTMLTVGTSISLFENSHK